MLDEGNRPALLFRERLAGLPLLGEVKGILVTDPGIDACSQRVFRVTHNRGV